LYLKITNKIGSTNYPAIKDKELNNSLADLAAGKFVSHDDVRRKVKLLLKNSKSKRPHYSFSKCAYFFLNFETFGATTEEQYGFLSPFRLK
jgi:hypothetical protein